MDIFTTEREIFLSYLIIKLLEKNRSEKMLYILNGISVTMFEQFPVRLEITEIGYESMKSLLRGYNDVSATITRKDIAKELSNKLGIKVGIKLKKIVLQKDDLLVIARHIQQKATVEEGFILPEKSEFKFYFVTRN